MVMPQWCHHGRALGSRSARAGLTASPRLIRPPHPAARPVLCVPSSSPPNCPAPPAASRSLPAVASQAIGLADLNPAARDRRLSRTTEQSRNWGFTGSAKVFQLGSESGIWRLLEERLPRLASCPSAPSA